jgi:protein transport protein SEC61 subunit gamma-like protein
MDEHNSFENPTLRQRASRFVTQCIRVLKVTRKPNKTEFRTLVKISGLGIAVIGAIGFVLHLLKTLLFPF